MRRRYLKKVNVVYRFKLRVLTLDEYEDLNEDERRDLWKVYLDSLYRTNQISKHQARTWKYPSKELK
jgi:hypothetical protein